MIVLCFIKDTIPTEAEYALAAEHGTKRFRTLLYPALPSEAHDLAVALDPEDVPEGYARSIPEVVADPFEEDLPLPIVPLEDPKKGDATPSAPTEVPPWGAEVRGVTAD